MPTCSPVRRRGEILREAVFAAALAEIAENGLRGSSMDRIARRASTGKSALYRRWPNVRALALDVFVTTLEESLPADPPDTGSLREDLLVGLRIFIQQLNGSLGLVVRELISESLHDPALAQEFQSRFGQGKERETIVVVQQAMARGEIPVQSIDPYVLQLPAAITIHQLLLGGRAPTEDEIAHVIDAIVLPLLKAPAHA
ncbi:MAG: TetR/AcrR family transcriptional regulator [Candidatus Nanopelagicales bacterium]|jgi:AcrR family transcriptional regulator|nr:TetR/AcrR family transcriptional regulator [Candidatus Nanopelagicales bacterium]MCF8536690.1 TetR/AcrR family transcriptional regulator [Candidatus Nanopelagicales bacterium]MCF8541835.1 TetR/AcrR family transcriptional regulator [Candidatus Nanopelagicales bacterium]MCF8556788.1 TetR/AcrR family transcriptional regulator [Candidatus Nanopelagicales bacterium]